MGCWSCNPFCGRCKPPRARPVQCPDCQTYNSPDFNQSNQCRKCGAELPVQAAVSRVVLCFYSGLLCANPCQKHTFVGKDGVVRPCRMNTPPPEGADLPAGVEENH